ncbi:hypothetical protein RSAG8_02248, partial [Rhizoctonia solani AG-8 WAC10335]
MASNDLTSHLSRKDVEGHIHKLIDSLVNIKDETGEFLLKLDDGRVIDTKGWNDWEWTHGVGLYGLLKLHEITGDESALKIALKWFADRLPVGTTKNTGLWHTLIDDPNSYVESSASAGFAYGILKAVRMRLLPNDPAYISSAKRAIAGVVKCISPKGELEQCSFGTPVFKDLDGYRQIPITSMPYGQALALLALTEELRTYL